MTRYIGFLAILAFPSAIVAQVDSARLIGLVTDPTGAAIPGAKITVKNLRTGATREVTSNSGGEYFVTNLSPASYEVKGQATNLGPMVIPGIPLTVGQERRLDLVLQPEALSQPVNVTETGLTTTDMSSVRIGANVNEREVANMPLNGRQLSQLYLLAPGAQTAGGGSYDNIRFSGRANQQNAIRFDGVEGSSIIEASPGNLNGETSTGFRLPCICLSD